MKKFAFVVISFFALLGTIASAQTTRPALQGAVFNSVSAEQFEKEVNLAPLRAIAVQHQQTIKTLDSYCRQELETISGRATYNGQDPVFTVLDMIYHPADYESANIIKIKNLPLRSEFRKLPSIPLAEQERIYKTGMVSLNLLRAPAVQTLLQGVVSNDNRRGQAVNETLGAAGELDNLLISVVGTHGGTDVFVPTRVIPPATSRADDLQWRQLIEIAGVDPKFAAGVKAETGASLPPPLPGYLPSRTTPCFTAAIQLIAAWQARDPKATSEAGSKLADALAAVNPAVYPSELQRNVEVIYNKLAKMTLPGAAFYFFAMVCFLMATRSGFAAVRLWALRLLVMGFAIHTTGIAVRWWLVGSIPIKNEFESVMFSAWFGVGIGLLLEMGIVQSIVFHVCKNVLGTTVKIGLAGRSILGAAAAFIGWLSLIAIFTVPYVFHTSIGENIGQVNGVLMSYWLYIHVVLVTASYALIGMGFLLSLWWLIKYYADGMQSDDMGRTLRRDTPGFEPVFDAGGSGALTVGSTLAGMLFIPRAAVTEPVRKKAVAETAVLAQSSFMNSLDACNLVVLQLAFYVLGVGIICGAVWADESWGRPWGWDPKEVFALVTWIVYLVVVHVRVVTPHKAWWTSVLACIGFFIMLFNWIGVNYFLPGLHSYAG